MTTIRPQPQRPSYLFDSQGRLRDPEESRDSGRARRSERGGRSAESQDSSGGIDNFAPVERQGSWSGDRRGEPESHSELVARADQSLYSDLEGHRRSAQLGGGAGRPSYRDAGTQQALEALPKRGEISGPAFERAIVDGTKDFDSQAAGREHADIRQYSLNNWSRLSPDAREKFRTYDGYAREARAEGRTGIDGTTYEQLKDDLRQAGYADQGAGRAIEDLRDRTKGGPIGGDEMYRTIRDATSDRDNQSAHREYSDLKTFSNNNRNRMTPEAQNTFNTYERYAQESQAKGQTGIPDARYDQMLGEMKLNRYQDQSSGRALERLPETGEISGQQFGRAILDGTRDADNQSAGKEYNDIKGYADKNWDRLSPDAREKYRTYDGYAKESQAAGETGISDARYKKMEGEINRAGYADQSSGRAIEGLRDKKGELSGADVEKAIISGTEDRDRQAAGTEYKDFKKFAGENWDRFSPDGREKFRTYEKYATAATGRGETGINDRDYEKMRGELKTAGYQDAGSGRAIEGLKGKTGTVSGDDLQKAIVDGTKDLDNQSAGREYKDFKKYSTENWDKLSPEARAKFGVYEGYAQDAQKRGQTGIDPKNYEKMKGDMRVAGYQDKGAGQAIEDLKDKTQGGRISGDDMQKTIVDATIDRDNQSAGKEYRDLKKFAGDNWERMSPEAQSKFGVYEKYAKDSQRRGQTGIDDARYEKMQTEMRTAGYEDKGAGRAIEELKDRTKGGSVSGAEMERTITDATKDYDNQSAGKEYRDLSKFKDQSWDRMSPDAREKFRVYEKYAQAAQGRGETGIPEREYQKMQTEMRSAGYRDAGAGSAIESLRDRTQGREISGRDMERTIVDATKDYDNQSAGTEHADLSRFARQNWDRLSPDAREKLRTYEQYVDSAKARGMTGIPDAEYRQMQGDLRRSGYEDASSARAIEQLKGRPGEISGADMERAIIRGTEDFDNRSAGREYNDFSRFATDNWQRLSPDAREKFRTYENAVISAKLRGLDGIPNAEWQQMTRDMGQAGYKDHSTARAIEDHLLSRPGVISGDDMRRAIISGTSDLDNQSAGREFSDLSKAAQQNWHRMSPDAKEAWRTYERYAVSSQTRGMTGIPQGEWDQMVSQLKTSHYYDASAGAAIEQLKMTGGMITGGALINAIHSGTYDHDGQAGGSEFADFYRFAGENWHRFTPDAQSAFRVYSSKVGEMWDRGSYGIPDHEYNSMLRDMRAASDLLLIRGNFSRI